MQYASPFLYVGSLVMGLITVVFLVKWKLTDKPVYKLVVVGSATCSLLMTATVLNAGWSETRAVDAQLWQEAMDIERERMAFVGQYITEHYGVTSVALLVDASATKPMMLEAARDALSQALDPAARLDVVSLNSNSDELPLDLLMVEDVHSIGDRSVYHGQFDRIIAATGAEVILDLSNLINHCLIPSTGYWQLPEADRPDLIVLSSGMVDGKELIHKLENRYIHAAVVTRLPMEPEPSMMNGQPCMATAEPPAMDGQLCIATADRIDELRRWVEWLEIY